MSVTNDNTASDLWRDIVTHFRSLCFFKLQGNAVVSETILRQLLPKKIAEWSEAVSVDAEEQKGRLEEMFKAEQRRVDDVYTLHELSAMQWREDLIPALTNQIHQEIRQTICEQFALLNKSQVTPTQEITHFRTASLITQNRRRIAFDDIPAIIDLIVEDERKGKANFAA